MAEDLDGPGVLELISQELRRAQSSELGAMNELLESIRDAISDHPEDTHAKAAAALSTLVAYGSGPDQSDLDAMLDDLIVLVEGLGNVKDVYYVDDDLQGYREFSLRDHLPVSTDSKLTSDELGEVEAFIRSSFGYERPAPDGPPSGKPRP